MAIMMMSSELIEVHGWEAKSAILMFPINLILSILTRRAWLADQPIEQGKRLFETFLESHSNIGWSF